MPLVRASSTTLINNNDVSATVINNGQIHQKTDRVTKQAGAPELHASFNADSTLSPSVVRLALDLGDSLSPVDLLQGLGFTFSHDTTVFDANSTQVVLAGSVFGTRGTDFSADADLPAIAAPEVFPSSSSGVVTILAEGLAGQPVRIVLFDVIGTRVLDTTLPQLLRHRTA